jgi:TPR repeat protein
MGKIEDLLDEARKGSADAMMSLGCAYADGQIVPHDYSQAVIWF